MNVSAAKQFVLQNARPLDLAVYRYFFEGGSSRDVVAELAKFQNQDGGFGHGLEPDCFNPHSSPIATNDALITLFRVGELQAGAPMVKGMVRYLQSHDSFDETRGRWLFAIDSNREFPHAVWWEKEGDGIHGFNPTMSLAAFLVCFGERTPLEEALVRQGVDDLRQTPDVSGEALKCYLLAYELLNRNGISDLVDLQALKDLIAVRLDAAICKEPEKYGVEYVPAPSDFFAGSYLEFVTPALRPLIRAEQAALGKLQQPDGGFDISWEWGTPYPEFAQARSWWRPRLTIDKLLFDALEV